MFQLKLKEENNAGERLVLSQLKNTEISFWVDSSGGPEESSKHSFIGVNPKYMIYGSLNEVFLEQSGEKVKIQKNCFDFLEEKIKEEKENKDGIFVGYLTYDLFHTRTSNYPDFFFAYFDNIQSLNPKELKPHEPKSIGLIALQKLKTNMTNTEYLEKVKHIKNEIKEGNVYQANLTREYSITLDDVDEIDLYRKLRNVSPNPFGCYFKTPFVTILSSSPEEFLKIENRNKEKFITTRPIKGTLPKGVFEIDPKNKAENLMIVDLERNDLGKVCEPGSVKAVKLLDIETYQHLNHVVSTIEGKLKPNISLKNIFEAMFPGGSVTGAPKIAAMRIISEVEPTPRRGYTGTFGYIKTDGTMDFNILIRTIFIENKIITFNIGGGIVADSDPQEELEEIKLKARGILNTLGIEKL